MSKPAYSDAERDLLLQTAADAIEFGVWHHEPLPVDVDQFPAALQAQGACFVTLHLGGALRGCIGSTNAYRPLIRDVTENAFAASRNDPRFPPLSREELADLKLSISVLTPPEPMSFRDEKDLLGQLVPGRDGLIIEDGASRATFLPQVWEQLTTPQAFLDALKRKAGMRRGHWSRSFSAQRYEVVEIGASREWR